MVSISTLKLTGHGDLGKSPSQVSVFSVNTKGIPQVRSQETATLDIPSSLKHSTSGGIYCHCAHTAQPTAVQELYIPLYPLTESLPLFYPPPYPPISPHLESLLLIIHQPQLLVQEAVDRMPTLS